jgi:hypothetical protein
LWTLPLEGEEFEPSVPVRGPKFRDCLRSSAPAALREAIRTRTRNTVRNFCKDAAFPEQSRGLDQNSKGHLPQTGDGTRASTSFVATPFDELGPGTTDQVFNGIGNVRRHLGSTVFVTFRSRPRKVCLRPDAGRRPEANPELFSLLAALGLHPVELVDAQARRPSRLDRSVPGLVQEAFPSQFISRDAKLEAHEKRGTGVRK